MNSIEKGIVELINQHGIRKLVMGAAADKHYSKKMMEPKSKKAIYVHLQAPITCHIWFICKGHLVHTREGRSGRVSMEVPSLTGVSMEVASSTVQASPNTDPGPSSSLRSRFVPEGTNDQLKLHSSGPHCHRVLFDFRRMRISSFTPNDSSEVTPRSSSAAEERSIYWDEISKSPPRNSQYSSFSSVDMADDSALTQVSTKEDHHQFSSPPSVLEGRINDKLYDQLEKFMAEAQDAKRNAFDESMKRRKAEKDAIDALRRAKALENFCAEELRQRKEVEEMVKDLEKKMLSVVKLSQKYKQERDELQIERNNALKEAKELRKEQAEAAANTPVPDIFCEFSYSEIVEATSSFDPSLMIGQGGYGDIYKGLLCHTQVAIKMLHLDSMQGSSEFQQEVNVLSKLRHPNLVKLVGACPECCILVYEFLPNGSLEDRLVCKDESPPLTWQTRIRIATELCSALIFLHSFNPNNIIHGDLKPSNILQDSNYVSKLSDFGICRILKPKEIWSNNTTLGCITVPKGTFAYIDPEFIATGELTPKSDVYSFGIILLRLLTGRPPLGISRDVKDALDKGNLKNLLDPKAGDWPFVQAQQLAHIAMRCCEMSRRSRPDLASDVRWALERMRVSFGAPPFLMNSEEDFQTPYFLCPISQEIMQDPHVAADGYTYESEAFKRWLDDGHDASPVTKLKLPHFNLVPNRAVRTAIREWLQYRGLN